MDRLCEGHPGKTAWKLAQFQWHLARIATRRCVQRIYNQRGCR